MHIPAITQRCRACDSWRTCRRWLDRGGSGADYRDFCPNAEVFDRLRELENAVCDQSKLIVPKL